MAPIEYQPERRALDPILTGAELRSAMASVGAQAAAIARRYAGQPGAIQTELVVSYGRWRVNVINTSPGALAEEYGTRDLRPTRPLGWTLDAIEAVDPKRGQARR